MEYRYSAIVLGKKDIGETDRIYTFYTLENGKMQAIAKGVRKSEAKLAGALENFNVIDLFMARSRGMGKITGAIAEKNFVELRNHFDILSHSFQISETINRLIDWEQGDHNVFRLLHDYFETLERIAPTFQIQTHQVKLDLLQLGFHFKLFDFLGYGIEAGKCVLCGVRLGERNYFNSQLGGTVCGNCRSNESMLEIFPNSIKLIRIFLSNKLSSLPKLTVDRRDINNLKLIQREFTGWNMR